MNTRLTIFKDKLLQRGKVYMLTLPIKKKWFDMILSGEKKEEYREHNDYYFTRFSNLFGISEYNREIITHSDSKLLQSIKFRNGYRKDSPYFIAKCRLEIGCGKEKWGAEDGKIYYILKIIKIEKVEI